ncbi:type VI secretion system baseplate subunit TssF [Paraburkholderia bonniea]|uniref:type VI secretion system baseplate subunit TssF n=1 Tax=Paraburkholderia bonniea TaxID=2152891 RepID=UPI00129203A3|nr:type VI secretion system baseplate subunit TssF [Paraburkholderia bonniea]WJF89275.1 type VI secretion system baseplate subunit TssF [Paraburkholderia bonniea]WJF92591.1 type VI secretion system baseplate subunit TssF [Paraburkholderia bonniea]
MLNTYFEQELGRLRGLASEFAALNPALAPLLGADVAPDPDVERLLEGVAFLTGLMRQRLDDEFPEFVQSLAQMLFPHFLQPWPCMTVLQFQPKGPLGGTVQIPAGTEVASVPVDGVRTMFRTSFAVALEPLTLRGARWDGEGTQRSLVLDFAFDGVDPNAWRGKRLRLYLGDAVADASRLLLLMMRYVREIHLSAPGAAVSVLPSEVIGMAGLDPDAALVPQSDNTHPAHALLREYFVFPEKFLYLDIGGFERWSERGTSGRFSLRFVLNECPDWAPALTDTSFQLNTTPAVNLYEAQAHPISFDERQAEYPVRLQEKDGRRVGQIFSLERVSGYTAGEEVDYLPFAAFAGSPHTYHLRLRESPLKEGVDCFLSLARSPGTPLPGAASGVPQTLSIEALCTHGALPEVLRLGDICLPTDNSPSRMSFHNIRPVTSYRLPVLDDRLLWRMVSHLSANHLRLSSVKQLRQLLSLQLAGARAGVSEVAQQRRIDAIEAYTVTPAQRLMGGVPVTGCEIGLVCRSDAFVNLGGLFLFGAMLDEFFAGIVGLNAFSRLSISDPVTGETLQWPAKIGQQQLL